MFGQEAEWEGEATPRSQKAPLEGDSHLNNLGQNPCTPNNQVTEVILMLLRIFFFQDAFHLLRKHLMSSSWVQSSLASDLEGEWEVKPSSTALSRDSKSALSACCSKRS